MVPSLELATPVIRELVVRNEDLLASRGESSGTVCAAVSERTELLSIFSDKLAGQTPTWLLDCHSGLVKRTGLAPRANGGKTPGVGGTHLEVLGAALAKAGVLDSNLNCGVLGAVDIGVAVREGTLDPIKGTLNSCVREGSREREGSRIGENPRLVMLLPLSSSDCLKTPAPRL